MHFRWLRVALAGTLAGVRPLVLPDRPSLRRREQWRSRTGRLRTKTPAAAAAAAAATRAGARLISFYELPILVMYGRRQAAAVRGGWDTVRERR